MRFVTAASSTLVPLASNFFFLSVALPWSSPLCQLRCNGPASARPIAHPVMALVGSVGTSAHDRPLTRTGQLGGAVIPLLCTIFGHRRQEMQRSKVRSSSLGVQPDRGTTCRHSSPVAGLGPPRRSTCPTRSARLPNRPWEVPVRMQGIPAGRRIKPRGLPRPRDRRCRGWSRPTAAGSRAHTSPALSSDRKTCRDGSRRDRSPGRRPGHTGASVIMMP